MITKKLLTTVFLLTPFISLYAQNNTQFAAEQSTLIFIIPIFIVAVALFFSARLFYSYKPKDQLGFLSITPHRPQRFFPIDERIQNMVPVVDALADEQTNVYSNLNKITLSMKSNGVYLEDKNYKISILVNRRRSRRCFLNNGDILDMGELTIMFKSPMPRRNKFNEKNQSSSYTIPRARRVHGKIIKNTPKLIPLESREKTYYITKNITLVGHSEMNDLIPKSKGISPMHSRIERVAGKFKLVDLNSQNGTFVNGRRIDTKMLKEGDEISFESIKYTFTLSDKAH